MSCSEKSNTSVTPFEFEKKPLPYKLKKAIESEYLTQLQLNSKDEQFLSKLYNQSKFNAFWVNDSALTKNGRQLLYLLKNKLALGVPTSRNYPIPTKSDNFIQKELKLTICLGLIINDLKYGFLEKDSVAYAPLSHCKLNDFTQFTHDLSPSKFKHLFWKSGPQDTNYQKIAPFLYNEYFYKTRDVNRYTLTSYKKDSLNTIDQAATALKTKGYLKEKSTDSLIFTNALKHFQEDNQLKADGVVGQHTANALNESSIDRLHRIALEMNRLRNQAKKLKKYIHVNLAEYMLRFYVNDTLMAEHNIVIGKLGNETPQLSTSLRKIIVYPYWKVPYSIASKEILPAAKNNSNYFKRNNYKIYRKEVEVDPETVNWKKIKETAFPYVVIQQPGPKNSLGIIKFDMPNSQSIYIHDTPSKGLFGTKTRAYSHGCMRCQNPIELAKIILERDEQLKKFNPIIPDSLDSILARGENYEIPLLNRIPILMEYRTVVVQNGDVLIYPDIYGREAEYIKLFSGN